MLTNNYYVIKIDMVTIKESECIKKVCPQFEKNQINAMKKIFTIKGQKPGKKTIKHIKNTLKNSSKKLSAMCKKTLCNPTCAGTSFENKSKIKDKLLLSARKMVSNKEKIIKNGFYEKLPLDVVKQLKKDGALSGCKAF